MSFKTRIKITHGLGEKMWTLKGPDLAIDANEPSLEAALKRQEQAVKASVLTDYGADFEIVEAKTVVVTTYSVEKRKNAKLSSFGAGAREEERAKTQEEKDLLEAEAAAQEKEWERQIAEEEAVHVAKAEEGGKEKEKLPKTRRGRGGKGK